MAENTQNKNTGQTNGVTDAEIQKWKQEHGEVYHYEVDGYHAYLKPADRKTISHANAMGENDDVKFNEILLDDCWLGGDEIIKQNDSYFLGISSFLAELIQVKAGQLKKL